MQLLPSATFANEKGTVVKRQEVKIGFANFVFFLVSVQVGNVAAQTVTINGTVTASTCSINSSNGHLNIAMPTLAVSSLPTPGSTAGSTFVTLIYSNCATGMVSVTPYFEIGGNANAAGRLVNTAPGGAMNVELRLKNSDGSNIDLSKPYGSQNVASSQITSNSGRSDFIAEYYATGTVQPGQFNTAVNYSLIYQ